MRHRNVWGAYYAPTTSDEVLGLLAQFGPAAQLVAGGTDLLVEARRGQHEAAMLIDVSRIREPAAWNEVHLDGAGVIHVGPLVTHNQVAASELIIEKAFPLALACWQVGTPQLRNRGTVAGNLVTASPANDTITALLALDAQVTLMSVRGERRLPLERFYRGVRQTVLEADEMLTDIAFPAMGLDRRGIFVKLGLRRTHAIALVNACVVATFQNGLAANPRITLGSVAPTIIRAPRAEAELHGSVLGADEIDIVSDLAAETAAPIDDVRARARYRREMVRVLVRRALSSLGAGSARELLPQAPPKLWGQSGGRFSTYAGGMISHREADGPPIECSVNGRRVAVQGAASKTLLDMLRQDLGLTGTKEGCGEGECGSCTVWMDEIAVLACLVPAPRAHGTQITTIEGLASDEGLHPVQHAFITEGAVQCGYCTPGFIMSGANLLQEVPDPDREQILAGLQGNLCRCTGYYKIIQAIESAAGSALSMEGEE